MLLAPRGAAHTARVPRAAGGVKPTTERRTARVDSAKNTNSPAHSRAQNLQHCDTHETGRRGEMMRDVARATCRGAIPSAPPGRANT